MFIFLKTEMAPNDRSGESVETGIAMTLIEDLQEDRDKIAQVGAAAIARARLAGVPAYYIDRSVGEGIVKLMPDGTIHLLDSEQADEVVLRTISPGR